MTVTELEGAQLVGIHALYPDVSYETGVVGEHFVGIEEVWQASLALAFLRTTGIYPLSIANMRERNEPELFYYWSDMPRWNTTTPWLEMDRRAQQAHAQSLLLRLTIYRLRAESPMDLSIAIQGGAAAGVSIYALHLLRTVLKHPEDVGAWLPRLLAGWRKGMSEADQAKKARDEESEAALTAARQIPGAREILEATPKITMLKPVQVEPAGAGELPEDIAEALREYTGGEG